MAEQPWEAWFQAHFRSIHEHLERLESTRQQETETLMATLADLDTALATVDGDITAVGTAVQSIVTKLAAAGNPVDVSAEVDTLTRFHTALAGDTATIDAAVTPPAPPTPPAPTA